MSRCLRIFLLLASAAIALPWATAAQGFHVRIPEGYVIAVYPNPSGSSLLVYVGGRDSDDTAAARVGVINLRNEKRFFFTKFIVSDSGSDPIWNDGKFVIASTTGIVALNPESPSKDSSTLIPGETYGEALSHDGSRIAFWNWQDSSMGLFIRSLGGPSFHYKWKLPFAYGSEPYAFQIVFNGSNVVLARTFDTLTQTPLKSFDVTLQKPRTLERDCLALARSSDTIYFIANQKDGTFLKKMNNGQVATIRPIAGYEGLHTSSDARWLILTGRRKSAIFDTESDRVTRSSLCDFMSVLADGTVLYASKSVVSSDEKVCRQD